MKGNPPGADITSLPKRHPLALGATRGGPFISTNPNASRCCTIRSVVIRAIVSSAWCTRFRPW
jgi:hypothetical protein